MADVTNQQAFAIAMQRATAWMDAMHQYQTHRFAAGVDEGVENTIRFERERFAAGVIDLDYFEQRVESLLRLAR